MSRWDYFVITPSAATGLDAARVRFARRDLDGDKHNCETLQTPGVWRPSDFLERYFTLGSADKDIVELTAAQMADLIRQAVHMGRFKDAPVDPASLVEVT